MIPVGLAVNHHQFVTMNIFMNQHLLCTLDSCEVNKQMMQQLLQVRRYLTLASVVETNWRSTLIGRGETYPACSQTKSSLVLRRAGGGIVNKSPDRVAQVRRAAVQWVQVRVRVEEEKRMREREGEKRAMNVSVLPNVVGEAVFIASNGTPA